MSESMAILDRHTAQFKQLIALSIQQSENTSFLIHEILEIKTDVAGLKTGVATLTTDVASLKTGMAVIKTDVTALKAGMLGVATKLDCILGFLEAPGK